MAGLNSSISTLITASKMVRKRWDDTKNVWNDPVSRSFEKQYWTPIEDHVQSTIKEMQNLAHVIEEAQCHVR